MGSKLNRLLTLDVNVGLLIDSFLGKLQLPFLAGIQQLLIPVDAVLAVSILLIVLILVDFKLLDLDLFFLGKFHSWAMLQ